MIPHVRGNFLRKPRSGEKSASRRRRYIGSERDRLGMTRIAPDELARLYREHAPALRLYARQWRDGGEDVVQDAFVRLAQQSPAPERPAPWLFRVVRNAALAVARAQTRRGRREAGAVAAEAWYSTADD